MNPESLAGRIFAVRKAWGWSQHKMAHVLGVDQASISLWERGCIIPSGSAVVALCALFGCRYQALDDGTGWVLPNGPADLPIFTSAIEQFSNAFGRKKKAVA